MNKILLYTFISFIFIACAKEEVKLGEGNFTIVKIKAEKELSSDKSETKPYISFIEGNVTGTAGCNTFFGGYEFKDGILSFDDNIAVTRKLCDNDTMVFEDIFLRNLRGSFKPEQSEDGFILKGQISNIYLQRQ